MSLEQLLSSGIQSMGLGVDVEAQENMLRFLELLQKWNRVYNLTAIKKLEDMVTKHLLDSLSILPYVKGDRVLDIGTGAGLPGIPLAITLPDKSFALLDSVGKKCRFLRHVKLALGLSNVEIVENRVEQFHDEAGFDTLTTRAVGPIVDLYKASAHLVRPGAQWLFMKGLDPKEELQSFDQSVRVLSLAVPGLNETRHVVIVQGD